jgi:hypothetical protein
MGAKRLAQLTAQLTSGAPVDEGLLSAICGAIGAFAGVLDDEVALLRLTDDYLRFVLPAKLQSSGVIPVQSMVALAAQIARERQPVIVNDFALRSHARVFEEIGPKDRRNLPIQKMLAAPVFRGDQLVGVVQLSRKGVEARTCGPDFTASDAIRLRGIVELLATLATSSQIELNRPAAAPAQEPGARKVRRDARVQIAIPVEVIYPDANNRMVLETTQTNAVSAYGACIVLKQAPRAEQSIVLIHRKTREEVFCRVADTRAIPKSTSFEVGIGFLEARPKFWRIVFPSPDWDPSERKRYSIPQRKP